MGASAAMEMGDIEKALKFYQSCLRHDPDQRDISKQYKGAVKRGTELGGEREREKGSERETGRGKGEGGKRWGEKSARACARVLKGY